ncbi:phage tail terminator protein [Sphingobium cloacae]|uniref:Uncharacterized protein n=1 Tax=Sphingobium cloacae TaxID=120107 RepID=A0A1E1F2N6_9SPHN|nr:hypothetical protein [Sphingobium cloacae]BAV64766.1 hypothetical protein SCLO_1017260 [Sphingobium cloacae]
MFGAVKERLEDIAALGGRIEPAASLSELMRRNQAPQVTPAAFILPLGLRGGRGEVATGIVRQPITEALGVVLFLRSAGDAKGGKSADALTPIRNEVIRRIVGWAPPSDWLADDTVGVFTLSRGEMVSLSAGLLIYQLDFAVDDQLRI